MRYEDDTISQQSPSFWETLRIFWSAERVDIWYYAIFSTPARTEVCQNLLCLCPNAHAYWERAYFVLKPIRISDDKKRRDVQFFWLLSNPHVLGVNILQAPSLSAPDHGPNLARLFNHETISQICSGDEISLKTDDPVLRPLPDFRLLEMQWVLHRVTALSGAAEPQDDFHDKDRDDEIMSALQEPLDMYTEDDWDMEIEELPATEHFEEVTLRGGVGHREKEDHKGEDHEGEGGEGEEQGSS
jgi:HNH endonuclease